ncbi:hypothetical protein GCM10009751_28390 [Myceligenerans crystallogenes]|uniref:EamA domain-containing protein n=1 Tax=Myceligenerans crystallogenes TaxID=316335 RepID=A0ABN2NGD4_9MICO
MRPAVVRPRRRPGRLTVGYLFALVSAMAFGLSGSFAKGLLDAGWSAGAAVTLRVLIGAAVLAVPALLALRGRWSLLRENAWVFAVYGLVAVAGTQLTYFYAVSYMDVAVALLIEFLAPIVVVGWMWARHGRRPGPWVVAGGAVALTGLALVLDLAAGGGISARGVLWALGAMAGCAVYFVMSARPTPLPPVTLAAGGLLVGGAVLLVAGLVGVVPFDVALVPVRFRDLTVDWWVPVLGLGLVTAAVAYVAGIAASRRLGARLASFAGLSEAVLAVIFAWLLLGQSLGAIQLLGGALILAGVVMVRAGETA